MWNVRVLNEIIHISAIKNCNLNWILNLISWKKSVSINCYSFFLEISANFTAFIKLDLNVVNFVFRYSWKQCQHRCSDCWPAKRHPSTSRQCTSCLSSLRQSTKLSDSTSKSAQASVSQTWFIIVFNTLVYF